MKKLTRRQALFVDEYLVDLNAAQAAIRAGYADRKANGSGAQVMARPEVAAAIQAKFAERARRTEITQDRVLKEIARLAFIDHRQLMSWGADGVVMKESAELGADEAAAVAEVSEAISSSGRALKMKIHDKVRALELLGRHLGMFNDKLNVGGQPGNPVGVSHNIAFEDGGPGA